MASQSTICWVGFYLFCFFCWVGGGGGGLKCYCNQFFLQPISSTCKLPMGFSKRMEGLIRRIFLGESGAKEGMGMALVAWDVAYRPL